MQPTLQILLIDDDADDRLIFGSYLQRIDSKRYALQTATSYDEGLRLLRDLHFDACFVDYRLDAHTGFDILEAVNDIETGPPVIVLTGVGNDELGIEALRLGATDYLTKDLLSPKIIQRAIRYAMERHSTRDRERALITANLKQANIERERQTLVQLFEQSPAIINLYEGPDHRFTTVHPHMSSLLGDRNLEGHPLAKAMPELISQGIISKIDHVYKTGEVFVAQAVPLRLGHADGTYRNVYFDLTYQPWRGSAGEIVGVMSFAVDVTQQVQARRAAKESEERFRFMAESLPQKIFTATSGGAIDYFNNQWMEFSGLPVTKLKQWGWLRLVHPDDRIENVELWQQALESGEPFQIEHRFERADGSYRWHLTRAIPMYSEQGNVSMWLGSSTDIHDIKELERQKDDFIAIASHELKTPVTSIKAYAQIMQRQFIRQGDEAAASKLARIDHQLDKLTQLIVDLLDVTKIESGKLRLHLAHFNFADLLTEAIETVQVTSDLHRIRLEGTIDYPIVSDRERIGQVLVNLLSNAVKYSPQNHEVTVVVSSNEEGLTVEVQDEGIGIPADKRAQIFDRFYRVGGKGSESYPGLGLGLYISSEIMSRLGGKIWVKPNTSQGSIFGIWLPPKHVQAAIRHKKPAGQELT